jgi:osmotically-inducible protein OsmY
MARSWTFALLAFMRLDGSQHHAASRGYSKSPILAVLLLLGVSMKSDSDIKKDVLEELLWDPLVPEARVGVAVRDAIVTLNGHLDTYAEKIAVKRAVERVSGVKAIAVELDVIPMGAHKHSDTEIAAAVEHALSWNTSVPQGRVRVVVEKGWVTLSGELDWNFQRRAVERMVRPLKGVVGIVDNIRLKSLPVPVNLANRISDALTRQAMREAKRIEISMEGSIVTLTGHVHSWAERTAAEGATWSAPGVSRVNNMLTVDESI